MGVSGSGKTTIGTAVASQIGAVFADADDYHPAVNKAKMAAGTPLTDEDRAPWLQTLNGVMQGWAAEGKRGVLACSALKATYRDTLAQGLPEGSYAFVWLDLPREVLAARLAVRKHQYMNPKLLDSQLATLEPPTDAVRVVNDRAPAAVVAEILQKVGLTPNA